MSPIRSLLGPLAVALTLALPAAAQSNSIPGLDVSMGILGGMAYFGRIGGAFPNGTNGFAMSTTSCNLGTVNVPWLSPMQENHPTIAFMIVREENGRLEQISDASYVKHGFFALSNSQCTPCQNPSGGSFLGVGCSDTYSTGNNGDNYYLGPPQEINPWLGTWTAQCSHFDRGEPAVAPPANCDGIRSLSSSQASALGPVGHRVRVTDADLNHPQAIYWYQGQYVVRSEPEANRDNNLASKRLTPTWNGSSWSPSTSGSQLQGSVLKRWTNATVTSGKNGNDDGLFYVGSVVTNVAPGTWHYEYGVHNRDNLRGGGALRIPIPAGALVSNLGFRDIDGGGANDWSVQVLGNEIVWSTGSNPLQWNQIFNFWFDCNVPPSGNQPAYIDQHLAGAGAPTVTVLTNTPLDPCPPVTVYCTAKVNSLGCTPAIAAGGMPSATSPVGFMITASNVVSNEVGILFFGHAAAGGPFQGGTLCVQAPVERLGVQNAGGNPPPNDCSGTFSTNFNLVIQGGAYPSLTVGASVFAQHWSRDAGDLFGTGLTDAVTFQICP